MTFVATGTTAAQFNTNYKWGAAGFKTSPDVANNRRAKRLLNPQGKGTKTTLTVLMHDSGTEVARLNVWVVGSAVTFDHFMPDFTSRPLLNGLQSYVRIWFNHSITPTEIFTNADRPDLTGIATGPFTDVCDPNPKGQTLADGAKKLWDATRQVYTLVVQTPSSFPLSIPNCADDNYHAYPTGTNANVIGNDDREIDDENDIPTTAGRVTSNDSPSRVIGWDDGVSGNKIVFNLYFREFTRLKLNDTWYRIAPFHLWRVSFGFLKGAMWDIDPDTSKLVDGTN